MEKPTKTQVTRIAGAIKRSKKKVLTLDQLSRLVGLYPDVLGNTLSYFSPMILMDPSINCVEILPDLEAYLAEPVDPKKAAKPKAKRVAVTKKELLQYTSIQDFLYKKMTSVGGLLDRSASLSDQDLATLKKLVDLETAKRKKAAKKAH